MSKEKTIGHNQNPIQEKLEKSFKKILTGIRLIDGAGSEFYTAIKLSDAGKKSEPFQDIGYGKLMDAGNVLLTALNAVEDVLKDQHGIPYQEEIGLSYSYLKEGDITKEDHENG